MRTIQPGHEVLSVFSASATTQALTKRQSQKGLIVTIGSAFFIVAVLGLVLNFAQKAFAQPASSATQQPSAQVVYDSEPVAFEPGQQVSQYLQRGYLK